MKTHVKQDIWWAERPLRTESASHSTYRSTAGNGWAEKRVWIATFSIAASVPIVGCCLKAAVIWGI
jgi:hypothetical protein